MPSTEHGRPLMSRRRTAHRATPLWDRWFTHSGLGNGLRTDRWFANRAVDAATGDVVVARRRSEWLSSAAVILAGVFLVVSVGVVATRVIRTAHSRPQATTPQIPALGNVTLPPANHGVIPLTSPSPSQSPTPSTSPTADHGTVTLAKADVPDTVNLSAEGSFDWVHWANVGTYSLERDKAGGFAILEGAPTAPRFRHALSPQRFTWTGGDPVATTDGTPTGVRTCGTGNGFTLSAPAGTKPRVLRVYVGTFGARGRLTAGLTTSTSRISTVLEQREAALGTAVFTITYRAPSVGRLELSWVTDRTFVSGCAGVALQAATLH